MLLRKVPTWILIALGNICITLIKVNISTLLKISILVIQKRNVEIEGRREREREKNERLIIGA
jgi:hypothetical protein